MSFNNKFEYLEQYKNMHIILEEDQSEKKGALWLGDYTAALDRETLKSKGINTVLTTAQGLCLYYPSTFNMQHKQWIMLDHPSFIISRFFQEVIQEIEEGLRRGGVLVHCAAGVSRSATSIIAYLMQKKKMSYLNAINFVRKRRSVISPNPGFLKQLQSFEKQLKCNSEIRRSSLSRNNNILSQTNPTGFQSLNNNTHSDGSNHIFEVASSINKGAKSVKSIQQRNNFEKNNQEFEQDENSIVVINPNEKYLHNLTKQTTIVPLDNVLKPKNSSEKKVDDKYLKNSMEMLKSKSHKFILKKSDSKGTIRLNRNNSVQPNNFINVYKQVEQTELKSVPQTTKSNQQQTIFDMLYSQQQLKKKIQTKPKKSVTIITPNTENQIKPMFISQAQKNLRKTFSYLNTKENFQDY